MIQSGRLIGEVLPSRPAPPRYLYITDRECLAARNPQGKLLARDIAISSLGADNGLQVGQPLLPYVIPMAIGYHSRNS